jgi:hypothetical protein
MHDKPGATLRIENLRALVVLAALTACSAGDPDGRQAGSSLTKGDTGGTSGSGGPAGPVPVPAIGGNPGASGGISVVIGGSSTAGAATAVPTGPVCNAETRVGKRVPVDLHFLVDSSGSMAELVQGGTRWSLVSDALVSFMGDPRLVDTAVGISYFPMAAPPTCTIADPGCLCIPIINLCFANFGGSCEVADYAQPAVPLALPSNPAAVVSNIMAHQLAGGTPTRPAVEGALQYLSQWASQHPERRSVLVLATDGEPTGCDPNTPQSIATLVAQALAGPHAIRTYVIGVGTELVSLNLVAQAGGTGQAFLVDTGGDVAKVFGDALESIRGVASTCDFTIPAEGTDGKTVNPKKVNVRYTPNGATASVLLGQTAMGDAANCGAAGGWYYDNPSAPTLIKLCDTTCQSLGQGSIDVEFGCDTVVQLE